MRTRIPLPSFVLALLLLPVLAVAAEAKEEKEAKPSADALVRQVDKRMSMQSDYRGVVRIRETRKDGIERLIEMQVYRRDSSQNFLMVITQPRNLAGGGYLRIGKNLWEYNAALGHWERTTRRANIVGTIACEGDFDRSRLSEDYTAVDEGEEVIQGTRYRKVYLSARPDTEVSFAHLRLWLDPDLNIVKRIGYAPSGRVLRTDLVRSYQKLKDPVTQQPIIHYREVFEQEEEEGTQLVVRYEDVQLAPLSPNLFTKSWLEGRLR
ncbi:outer membrane lipoprotein-sorting protein [Myxococcus vastator]|uniref:outer membrane lipoprotein-sorting protein n=1 Tax=Myxococcus vastator TaxID=2709664 RepID=UPI0013D16D50|nr:outer membrane lipoprotein-sorting protein [Myxococcus vastator]